MHNILYAAIAVIMICASVIGLQTALVGAATA